MAGREGVTARQAGRPGCRQPVWLVRTRSHPVRDGTALPLARRPRPPAVGGTVRGPTTSRRPTDPPAPANCPRPRGAAGVRLTALTPVRSVGRADGSATPIAARAHPTRLAAGVRAPTCHPVRRRPGPLTGPDAAADQAIRSDRADRGVPVRRVGLIIPAQPADSPAPIVPERPGDRADPRRPVQSVHRWVRTRPASYPPLVTADPACVVDPAEFPDPTPPARCARLWGLTRAHRTRPVDPATETPRPAVEPAQAVPA
jgi:hypothetical protein